MATYSDVTLTLVQDIAAVVQNSETPYQFTGAPRHISIQTRGANAVLFSFTQGVVTNPASTKWSTLKSGSAWSTPEKTRMNNSVGGVITNPTIYFNCLVGTETIELIYWI